MYVCVCVVYNILGCCSLVVVVVHHNLLFLQRIDFERARTDALDPQLRHKPRLIADEELPAWLLRDEEEVGCCVVLKVCVCIAFLSLAVLPFFPSLAWCYVVVSF